MWWETGGPPVRSYALPRRPPADTTRSPQTIHMSDGLATLPKGLSSALFHSPYYYFDKKKFFNDRGWAR